MDDETVPVYTETDTDGFTAWLDALPERVSLLRLPLTHWPQRSLDPIYNIGNDPPSSPAQERSEPSLTEDRKEDLYTLQSTLITTFHKAITTQNTEMLHLLVSRGYVSPDVPDIEGTTPLIAALVSGHGGVVSTLVSLGASVNGYGTFRGAERTPLMVAAMLGRLALVKLLREDYGADDAIIAPDGQLALRLAAEGGHREVVEYLPARRGGAWRRWKTHHEVMVRRVRKAGWNIYRFFKFFVWDLPKFFLWTAPKHVVVLPLWKGCKWCWENRGRFGGWCKHQAREFPGRVARAGKAVWEGVKKFPKAAWRAAKQVPELVWDGIKEMPKIIKRVMAAVWRFIKRIPAAMKTVALWIWDCLKKAGVAVADVFLRTVSAIHTAVMAVLDFFRNISLRDVWNGVCDVFRAVFVGLPQAVWSGIVAAGKMTKKVLEGLFGCVGLLIWYLFKGLFWVVRYVPTQLWNIICGIGSSIAKGYHEILVWFNPKH